MFAWRSKPSRYALPAPRDVTQGAAGSRPSGDTGGPGGGAGPVPIETEHGADGDAEDRAAELVVPGEEVAQAVGQAEHPLAHRDVREDTIDQVCRLLRHAAAATTRTEAASFAREGHEALVGAVVAPHAREAPREHTARQELPELALDETGKAPAVGAVVSRWSRTTRWRTVPSAARG